jgi:PBP1b-binding outer membrane lipoprotein LpoB
MKKIAMLLSGLFIAIVLVGCTTKQDTSIQSNTTENTT